MATLALSATANPPSCASRPPAATIPSRSASLIVSSRSRSEATRSPRPPITFVIPSNAPAPATLSPAASPRGKSSLLRKLGRSLSNSRTQLVRRVSGSRPAAPQATAAAAPIAQIATSELPVQQKSESAAAEETAAPVRLTRGLRVLGRSKSEGRRRVGVATEEERMDELVRRAERSCGASGQGTEAASGMGSYFWSDSLGVCWDGREQVHPDLLTAQPTYSSNADFIPQSHPSRVVYASTLSTFPPRPPLRRLSSPPPPTLSPAEAIIAEYRAAHGTLTPAPLLDPIISNDATPIPTPVAAPSPPDRATKREPLAYARSVASDSSSSHAPSELRFNRGRASEDSSTSLESMRGLATPPKPTIELSPPAQDHAPPAPSPLAVSSLPRFSLVDDGPVKRTEEAVGKSQWATFTSGDVGEDDASSLASSVEDWRDCE